MLLAGLSETVLMSGLIFAYRTQSIQSAQLVRGLFILSLITTGTAALFGFLRYTGLWDNIGPHQNVSFIAKHLAMALFINLSAWGIYGHNEKRISLVLMLMSTASLTLNTVYSLPILSDAIIIASLALLMQRTWPNIRARAFVTLATTLLLSTLLWNLLIADANLRLAIFHVCLGGFYIALSLALAKPSRYFSNALE